MSQPVSSHSSRPGFDRTVLVVAADPDIRAALGHELERRGHYSVEVGDGPQALRVLESAAVDLVICEDDLGPESGLALLADARERWPDVPRVLLPADESASCMREAVNRAGVSYLLPKSWDGASLDAALETIGGTPSPAPPTRAPIAARRFPDIIGESPALLDLLDLVSMVGPTDSTVLVTGETGSGKELIGRALHEASGRRNRPFSGVNSAAFPETLLESELFGHTRGSFTGATSNKKGLFEVADKGTVFLDEVAEMPLSMQAKLLRFLQTGEIRPIGSESTRYVDVRLVAATNKDLLEEVEKGNFREDLYYRLAVIPLHVPPLRERLGDVPVLAEFFLQRLAARSGRPQSVLEPAVLDALMAYQWPGNVRELENVMERAVALSRSGRIGTEVLPRFQQGSASLHGQREARRSESVESLPVLERRHIIETLERVDWNRKRAAELLQISTTTLWRRLKEFGVEGKPSRNRLAADCVDVSGASGR